MMKIQMEKNKIFSPLRNKWLSYTPEEEVRQNYICTLVNDYGYSLEQMDEELQVNNSQRGQGKSRADIVIWKSKEDKLNNKNAFIVVECKSDNVVIHPEDYYQGNNYASWARAKFFITHNNAETKYFQMLEDKLPVDLNEIVNIPKATEVNDEEKLKELVEETKVFTRDEFSKLLFKCHNIIRNNDKLSPEGAFDEISKILFIKIRYERQQGKKVFSLSRFNELKKGYEETASKNSKPFYQVLFEKTKEDFEKDELFEANEEIKIRENSFEQIVKELERYNLSDTGDDVKGIAFEQFLGKTFRGELGQFFTPRTIVDFMVDIVDPKEGDLICDPCCGSGGFLIKAFDYVREKIEADILSKKEEIKKKYFDEKYQKLSDAEKEKIDEIVETEFKKLNKELDNQTEGSRLYDLSHKCIYGSDANPRMARTSKMNMIMHGDGHGGVHHNDGLLDVGGIFENRFDIVLTNPPFGSRVNKDQKITENDNKYAGKESYIQKRFGDEGLEAMRNLERNIGKNLIDTYETGNFSTLTEVLFMERYLRILKKGGKMAVVLPEGFLNNPNLQKVREYFEGRAKIELIVSIPQDVFIASGATVKPSLVFLQKFTDAESKKYEKIKEEASKSIKAKYQKDLEKLEKEVKELKGEAKKTKKKELDALNNTIDAEIKQEIKTKFDYQIKVAEVDKAGITTTGEECENELVELVEEYSKKKSKKYITSVQFKDWNNWDCKSYIVNNLSSKYPFVKLGDVLIEQTEKIKLKDFPDQEFGILGVNNKVGLFDAYTEKGSKINQPYKIMKEGWIAYNPYRVNVGSVGIKTKDHEYQYISNAYVVFSCNEEKLDKDFFYRLFKTETFNKLVKKSTKGSVRQNLSYDLLAKIQIPLPPIKVQESLIKPRKQKELEIEKLKEEIKQLDGNFEGNLFDL